MDVCTVLCGCQCVFVSVCVCCVCVSCFSGSVWVAAAQGVLLSLGAPRANSALLHPWQKLNMRNGEFAREKKSQLVRPTRSPQPEHNSVGWEAWNGSFVFDQVIVSRTTFHNLPWIVILVHSAHINRGRISFTTSQKSVYRYMWMH